MRIFFTTKIGSKRLWRLIKHRCVKRSDQSDNVYYHDSYVMTNDMSTKKTPTFCILYSCLKLVSTKPIVDKLLTFQRFWTVSKRPHCRAFESQMFSQNFPLALLRTSAQAGSAVLDCILSLHSGYTVYNSALYVPFCDFQRVTG